MRDLFFDCSFSAVLRRWTRLSVPLLFLGPSNDPFKIVCETNRMNQSVVGWLDDEHSTWNLFSFGEPSACRLAYGTIHFSFLWHDVTFVGLAT